VNTLFDISYKPLDPTIEVQFQTPIAVCKYMASLVPSKAKTILEPTAGIGNIVKVLEMENKYKITAPDDFFLLDQKSKFDCIIMNPPFSINSAKMENAPAQIDLKGMKIGYYILNECMRKSNNVIALMPWFTIIDSDVRMRYFKNWGMKSITSLPRKTFEYTRIQTCVLELVKGWKQETIFKTFNY
jgi:type I restriction-modification system DNA methylase subunit